MEIESPLPIVGPLQVVQAIQLAKQAQELFKKKDFSGRSQLLTKLAEALVAHRESLTSDIAQEQKLPINFVRSELIEAPQKIIENRAIEVQIFSRPETLLPIGVIGVGVQAYLAFSEMLFQATKALASGNALIISCPASAVASAEWLKKLLNEIQCPEHLITVLIGSQPEVLTLLAGHPGLAAFRVQIEDVKAEPLIKIAQQKRKKIQFFMGAKNSCLVHPDFDFENKMEDILRPFLIGQGQLSINCHRLFIAQSVEKKFYEVLKTHLQNLKNETPLLAAESLVAWEKSVQQVPVDSGKLLFGGKKNQELVVEPTWTQDLSNCSEMQQHEIKAPFFILTAVKYTHDMVKWSNTGYLGHSAVIWGPEEKARNLAAQLQVGHVHINSWSNFWNMGTPVKQSFFGNPDQKWSGSFYSDVKTLT